MLPVSDLLAERERERDEISQKACKSVRVSRLGTQGPALVLFCVVLFVIVCCVVEMEAGISFYSFFDFLLAGML